MSSAHIISRLQNELKAGLIVEAALAMMDGRLEEISAISYLPGDWLDIRLKGLPDISHIVHFDHVFGFRTRKDD